MQGYLAFYGPTLDAAAMTLIRDVPDSNEQVQCTVFKMTSDLLAVAGQQICFRLKAYNADGDSQFTDGVCAVLDAIGVALFAPRFPCSGGLASEDLSGRCRALPQATMGAFEATPS